MKRTLLALLTLSLVFTACNTSTEENGRLTIALTDAPFPSSLVDEANVTIVGIEARSSDSSTTSPYLTLSTDTMSFNLLDLTNGLTASLVDIEVPVGSYDLVRLYVSEASIKLLDSTVYDLTIPSSAQSGIKAFINPSIEVAGGLTSELLLDFDVSKSFVVQGNPDTPAGINGFIFKPAVKVSNLTTAGRLVGIVTDSTSTGLNSALVTILAMDTAYTSSVTDPNGEYQILGLPAGEYDVVFGHGTYTPDTVNNVVITAGNATVQDAQLL